MRRSGGVGAPSSEGRWGPCDGSETLREEDQAGRGQRSLSGALVLRCRRSQAVRGGVDGGVPAAEASRFSEPPCLACSVPSILSVFAEMEGVEAFSGLFESSAECSVCVNNR